MEADAVGIDEARRGARVEGQYVPLTRSEFGILQFFLAMPDLPVTRRQILENLHGPKCPVTDRAVDVQIAGLRKKLGSQGARIETVRGVGYCYRASLPPASPVCECCEAPSRDRDA